MPGFKKGPVPNPSFENDNVNHFSQPSEFANDVYVYGKLYADIDASDVFTGDPVSIKVDALPFQQFGDIQGTLVYVSDDTVEESLQGESGAFYRGRVNVEDSEILGLPEVFDLTPGMLASADLKVGKRRLITYFTNPILRSLSSAMREPD